MDCPDDNALIGWIHGSCDERSATERHVTGCDACSLLIAELLGQATLPDPVPAGPPLPLHPGLRLHRYEVIQEVGRGGMSRAYLARDPELDRKVCLKVLLPELKAHAGPGLEERLRDEARTLARLSHPNVVTVYDVGTWDHQLYLVMELISGGTLSEWLRAAPRAPAQILELFLAAGEGLAAAHEAGIVHRDFKPANVLVGDGGRARVADFGLSCVSEQRAPPAATPLLIGTPRYMSPEQLRGAPATASSDQFAFCVALCEALAGRPAFPGRTVLELRLSSEAGQMQLPGRDRAPERIRAALRRGLSADPAQRFDSMSQLLSALRPPAPRTVRLRWAVAAAALVAIAGTAGILRVSRAQRLRACREAGASIDQVWNAAAREQMERALTSPGQPAFQAATARVIQQLTTYAAAWTDARRTVCEATSVHGTQPLPLLEARVECLDNRRREFEALRSRLTSAEPNLVVRALPAVLNLKAVDECVALPPGTPSPPLPQDPTLRARVVELRRQAVALDVDVDLLRAREGLDALGPLLEEATRLGFAPLLAELWWTKGRFLVELQGEAAAAECYQRAYFLAHGSGHDPIAALAGTSLLTVLPAQREPPVLQMELATAAVDRVGRPVPLLVELEWGLGNVALKRNDAEAALEHHQRAAKLAEEAFHGSFRWARALSAFAVALRRLDRHSEAVAMQRQAVTLYETHLGPDHPQLAHLLQAYALVLFESGQEVEGTRQMRRSVELRERWTDPNGEPLAWGRALLGNMLVRHGEKEGLAVLEAAAGALRRLPSASPYARATAAANLGYAQYVFGEPRRGLQEMESAIAEATAKLGEGNSNLIHLLSPLCRIAPLGPGSHRGRWACRRMLQIAEATPGSSALAVAMPSAMLGEASLRQGRPAEALPLLRRAYDVRVRLFGGDDGQARSLRAQIALAARNARMKVDLHSARCSPQPL